ncbi:MAG: phosphoribosylanthranilate isomerase [Pseudomonadota bacterium]
MDVMKVCGLSTVEGARQCVAGGATHLGFIFFPKSPRNVTPEQAADLVDAMPAAERAKVQTVAVTVDADAAVLDRIEATLDPDMHQLHGKETVEHIKTLKQRTGKPVIKALAIRDAEDLERLAQYDGVADLFLLDAKPPAGSDLPGGNGVSFDWSLVAGLKTKTPILLSGGLDATNVAKARALVDHEANGLIGLDVSSGVEAAPGVKDADKIKMFLAHAV